MRGIGIGVLIAAHCAACADSTTASSDDAGTPPTDASWRQSTSSGGPPPAPTSNRGPSSIVIRNLTLAASAPPALDDVPCRDAKDFECGAPATTGSLPAALGGCLRGLYLHVRDGEPHICAYAYPEELPDAGALASTSFTWTCYGPAPVGERIDFMMETQSIATVSGDFFVRFLSNGDAGPVGYEAGGCFHTSSGTSRCASPDTPIATPGGERPIDSLSVGDLVYSDDGNGFVVVPIVRVVRVPVTHHRVVRLTLDDGRTVSMSAMHPDARGVSFGALVVGDRLGERAVARSEVVAYSFPYTVDVLPASRTGTYLAAGALVGSTLAR